MKSHNNRTRNIKNSNNSSNITSDNSNILSQIKYHKLPNNIPSLKYLNSSVFSSNTISSSREKTPKRIKSEIYLTEPDIKDYNNNEIINQNLTSRNDEKLKMREIFDYKTDKKGKILPSIKRLPPTMIYCCKERYSRDNLSKLYMKYFVSPPKNLKKLNYKIEKVKVRDTSEEYIDKTKSIILSRYSLKIKKEAVKRIEDNINYEIKSLDNTMKKIKVYQNVLDNNYINRYNDSIKKLYIQIENERIKNDELLFQLNKLLKDVTLIKSQINKIEYIKNGIEKWILFQIEMDKRIQPQNLKEFLKKEYDNKLIFNSVEDFKEWFVREENKNLKLLSKFQEKYNEKEKLEEEFEEHKKYNAFNIEIENEIQEKENLLKLVKLRNSKLEKEKSEILSKININLTPYKKKRTLSMNDNPIKIKDNIFLKVKYIYSNLKEKSKFFDYNFQIHDNNIAHSNIREVKILKMLFPIEEITNFLLFKYNEYKNDKNYTLQLKTIKAEIDLNTKKETAKRNKIEEEKKIEELKHKIDLRNKKFIYVPLRKVEDYPFSLYVKPKTEKNEIFNRNNELTLNDFLYENK